MKRNAAIATALVLIHLGIAVLHGQAHKSLDVDLEAWQWSYVYIIITALPLVAMVLYWTPWQALGGLLLFVSMAASFGFGFYFHFVAVSPDHVRHLPEGDAQGMFVATAVLLAVVEAAATAFGFWTFVKVKPKAAIPKP